MYMADAIGAAPVHGWHKACQDSMGILHQNERNLDSKRAAFTAPVATNCASFALASFGFAVYNESSEPSPCRLNRNCSTGLSAFTTSGATNAVLTNGRTSQSSCSPSLTSSTEVA